MILWLTPAFACETAALEQLAARTDLDPASTAAGLAKACPSPALRRALQRVGDPWEDVSLASRTLRWNQACPGGLEALPDGFEPADSGARSRLYRSCEVDPTVVDEAGFAQASGPPVTTVAVLHALRGQPTRRTLVRALLGVPDEPPPTEAPADEQRPLDAPDQTAAFAKIPESVPWPPNAKDPSCVVDVVVRADGRHGETLWVACDEEWRPYVIMALEGTLFEPAIIDGLRATSVLRMSFGPDGTAQ